MSTSPILCFLVFASLASICTQASADSVIIGTNTSAGNTYPFGNSTYVGEYQQVYNQADFSGPVQITSVSFFSTPGTPNQSITGSYILDFSTTSASTSTGPGGLSTTYASNLGSNNALFFTGVVSNVLTFNGTPFLYNPAQGDLLLDVRVITPDPDFEVLAAGCSADTNRIYNSGGAGTPTSGDSAVCTSATGYGLQTQFTFTPLATSATPEPSSIVLLGTGLIGLAGAVRRRL